MDFYSPPLDEPFSNLRLLLDGAEYTVRCEYNMRSGWYVGVTSPDGTVLSRPRKAVPYVPLLAGIVSEQRPRGKLLVVTLDANDTSKPSLADMGRTHFLAYIPEAEL